MSSNYPPGVTGNEPQISGVYSPDAVIDMGVSDIDKCRQDLEGLMAWFEDQDMFRNGINKDIEEAYDKVEKALIEWKDELQAIYPEEPDYEAMAEAKYMI